MGFSFFKRDTKDSRPANTRMGASTRTPAAPSRPQERERASSSTPRPALGRPTGAAFAVTENALPDRELQRSLAMATAAKIDAIESEMARDFLKPRKPAPEPSSQSQAPEDPVVVVEAAPPPEERIVAAAPPPQIDPSEADERDFDPGSVLDGSVDAIEVRAESSSALEEAAVLFANRQDDLAEAGLRGALHTDPGVASDERAWLMLLEFLQQRNDHAGFTQVSEAFVARFGVAGPAWFDYAGPEAVPLPATDTKSGMPGVRLPSSINSSIVKPLEEFKALALTNPALELDVSAARSIDLVGAELLLRVINAFKRASHELTLRGIEPLLVVVRSATVAGRRDPSDAAWMLALELQRLLNRQTEFEETGIEYCITYEVSPPSWEPPPLNIHVAGGASTEKAAPAPVSPGGIEWKGELAGDADSYFTRLIAAARPGGVVAIDCKFLKRMAFSAASALLGVALRLSQAGTRIEFREVNSLVAGLLQVLGIAGIADVRIRRV